MLDTSCSLKLSARSAPHSGILCQSGHYRGCQGAAELAENNTFISTVFSSLRVIQGNIRNKVSDNLPTHAGLEACTFHTTACVNRNQPSEWPRQGALRSHALSMFCGCARAAHSALYVQALNHKPYKRVIPTGRLCVDRHAATGQLQRARAAHSALYV